MFVKVGLGDGGTCRRCNAASLSVGFASTTVVWLPPVDITRVMGCRLRSTAMWLALQKVIQDLRGTSQQHDSACSTASEEGNYTLSELVHSAFILIYLLPDCLVDIPAILHAHESTGSKRADKERPTETP